VLFSLVFLLAAHKNEISLRKFIHHCRSTDYGDELTWAAAWLYKATNESQYLDEAEHHFMKFRLKERPNEFFYNKKVAGVQVRIKSLHD
jgi:endoglucanase